VPRRAALRRLASRRRAVAGRSGRRVAAGAGVAGLRPGRLGGARGGCARGPASGSGLVPEPEQEGRAGSQVRAVRAATVGCERDAADRRRRPRQRLPDRPAAAQKALLTEDRDARQALQAVLPHREDPGGRRECVRVGVRERYGDSRADDNVDSGSDPARAGDPRREPPAGQPCPAARPLGCPNHARSNPAPPGAAEEARTDYQSRPRFRLIRMRGGISLFIPRGRGKPTRRRETRDRANVDGGESTEREAAPRIDEQPSRSRYSLPL